MDKNLYEKTTVKVQKKSGFDKSHQNLFTGRVGTLVPILVDELIPNTSVDLEAAISAQLPPLASDTFMRCSFLNFINYLSNLFFFKVFVKSIWIIIIHILGKIITFHITKLFKIYT